MLKLIFSIKASFSITCEFFKEYAKRQVWSGICHTGKTIYAYLVVLLYPWPSLPQGSGESTRAQAANLNASQCESFAG